MPKPISSPAFIDAAGCAQWLEQLNAEEPHLIPTLLRDQLAALNQTPIAPAERLDILECLRDRIHHQQQAGSNKIIDAALPLSPQAQTVFNAINALWQLLHHGYQLCLQDWLRNGAAPMPQAAIAGQRSLTSLAKYIYAHLISGHELESAAWLQLHSTYSLCEQHKFETLPVQDNSLPSGLTSCTATYVTLLLICHAYKAEFAHSHLQLAEYTLSLCAEMLALSPVMPETTSDVPTLCIDLAAPHGILEQASSAATVSLRYLDMTPIASQIDQMINVLQQGRLPWQPPFSIALSARNALIEIKQLRQRWCEAASPQQSRHSLINQQVQICHGRAACCACIANEPFQDQEPEARALTSPRSQMLSGTRGMDQQTLGHPLETWVIEERDTQRVRLSRAKSEGIHLGRNELMALRFAGDTAFQLGIVIGVRISVNGKLQAGIRLLPGLPRAAAMKATGINPTAPAQYVAVLILASVTALDPSPCLIAPTGWFKSGRLVEIVNPDSKREYVRMEKLKERGRDFESIQFSHIHVNLNQTQLTH